MPPHWPAPKKTVVTTGPTLNTVNSANTMTSTGVRTGSIPDPGTKPGTLNVRIKAVDMVGVTQQAVVTANTGQSIGTIAISTGIVRLMRAITAMPVATEKAAITTHRITA
ncbi:MAG TPA: hypothetical protein VMW70_10810 [Burkholderiales bacterium]|nr:hypothetical protein [Burkholderiales bacterium]